MKKIIYIISLIMVILLSSVCFANDNFEADSRAMYTQLRHMGMNFDMGINYVNYKEAYRQLYYSYNDYAEKYIEHSSSNFVNPSFDTAKMAIYRNVGSCFNIYKATNEIWSSDVSSRSNAMSKIDWIWNEFPELQTLHRDWLGGYDTKKVMWIVLGYRQARENTLLNSINERYSKK